MAKLVIFLCLAAVVVSSEALNCYQCQGAECDKTMDQWRQQSCGSIASSGNSKAVCLKQTITDNGKQVMDRRCIIATVRDNKPFHTCSQGQTCEICEKDLCNSATVVYGQYALVAAVLSFLIPKYLL